MKNAEKRFERKNELIENLDFYFENGLMVLTAHFLKKRGFCCANECRHCPYNKNDQADYNRNVSSSSL